MKFDIDMEEAILARCLVDKAYLAKASLLLEAHHLSTESHSWIWKTVSDIWTKHREKTTATIFLAKAKRHLEEDERANAIELYRRLRGLKPKDSLASLEALEEFVAFVNVQTAIEKAAKRLEKGKVDDVYEVLGALKRRTGTRDWVHIEWHKEFEERQSERLHRRDHPEDFLCVPTGFPKLDAIMSGGASRGEVGLVLGTTGRGKSIVLNNMLYNAAKADKYGMLIGFEMPANQLAARTDSRWLDIAYNKLKTFDLTAAELRAIKAKYERHREKFKDKIQIYSAPVRSATIQTVRNMLDEYQQKFGRKPDALYLDSADHLLPVGRSESHRLDQAAVYWAVKGLAEEDGYVVWTSVHAGKEYENARAGAAASSESYDKSRIADSILSINEPSKKGRATKISDDDDDEEAGDDAEMAPMAAARGKYMELFLAKYRDGVSNIIIPIDAQLDRMMMTEIAGAPEE
jgi:replicative DNA helicase